jgi:hypothetical protein
MGAFENQHHGLIAFYLYHAACFRGAAVYADGYDFVISRAVNAFQYHQRTVYFV